MNFVMQKVRDFLQGLLILGFIAGGVLIYLGYKDIKTLGSAAVEPSKVSIADLKHGNEIKNHHVVVTDYDVLYQHSAEYTVERKRSKTTEHFFPMTAKGAGAGADNVVLVLVSDTDSIGGATVQGLLTGTVKDELPSKGVDFYNTEFPGIDLTKVWVLERGKVPASEGGAYQKIGGGIALLLVMIAIVVIRRKRSQG